MKKYISQVEYYWQKRDELTKGNEHYKIARRLTQTVINDIDRGIAKVCEKILGKWITHEWIKKAILLYFKLHDSYITSSTTSQSYDKIPIKFDSSWEEENFKRSGIRVVPGAIVRKGAYIGNFSIIMPSFINIGVYIGENTMIDTWATIGSCAQIGKNCHISGGVGIGGVLEPLQATPVIIEDNCFIGARSEITEGIIVEQGSIISMGVYITASTKIVNRNTGEIIYGRIPANSVVIPGTLPDSDPSKPSLACAVIVKQVDDSTRSKISINELLRSSY